MQQKKLFIGTKTVGVIKTKETVSKMEFRKSWINEGLRKWNDKAMHGQFLRNMQETMDVEQTWSWFRSSDLKVQMEGLICAAQEQALRTNYMKHHIDRTAAESPLKVEKCAVKRVRVCVI